MDLLKLKIIITLPIKAEADVVKLKMGVSENRCL
ncbi:hypothetical protein S2091_4105 [Solimicrobium silvestre]|uniref:Uncharacterized protein n=1 Tax=Solimicrobium silvestre TaxID=2099400 RepID=A0A2S9GU25_9BURK|nr:hypothetical protein S2091_4105 [Solimicrobium silvestre]